MFWWNIGEWHQTPLSELRSSQTRKINNNKEHVVSHNSFMLATLITPSQPYWLARLTLHMAAGALESVTTTSGNLIWDSLELGVWRPVTAAPENRKFQELGKSPIYLQLITETIQNILPIFREVFVSGEYEDMKARENLLEGLWGLLLVPGWQPGGGGWRVWQQATEGAELPFVISGLLNILLKQRTKSRWQEVCRLKICALIINYIDLDELSIENFYAIHL